MRDKRLFEGMSELEELSGGALAVLPVPEEKREEVFEETRRVIELLEQSKWVPLEAKRPALQP